MKVSPTIAILMATYNGEKYLHQQLDSILLQSYQEIKIYISDDCSKDTTLQIVQEYKKKFPDKIFYNINKSNLGVVKNFEQLIQTCEEPYMALADQDDIWKPNKLEMSLKKLKQIENNGPAMVHSDLTMIDVFENVLQESFLNYRKIKLPKDKSINKIISHNGVMGCTVLFNQQLKQALLPFPNSLDVHDYWIALVDEVVGRRYTINESLINYRIHENNTSNNIKKLQRKRNFYTKFINDDALPFIGLNREKVIIELMNRFNAKLNENEKKTILAFVDYLKQCKNPLVIFYNIRKYNLIREDFAYRMKIFIKLLQYKSSADVSTFCRFTSSNQLKKNVTNFLDISNYSWLDCYSKKKKIFYGWGRKKSGLNAVRLAKKHNTSFVLLEDGFIRSLGLAVDGFPSFSIVEDDVGIYYDASSPSKLENILNEYDFQNDTKLMDNAREAIELIVKHNISKYNNAKNIDEDYFKNDEDRVLVIAQTQGDSSLEYGMLDNFTTDDMLNAAVDENPNSKVYLKIHPDVLSGKKKSDIDIELASKKCTIIEEDVNPISLLEHFSKVYTKTSGMGFEALLVGCECVCFGMPFYAGWGVTIDKSQCSRRKAKRSVEEIFAAAYIRYTRYHNPYTKKASDIFDTIESIVKIKV